jgi:hypothetical protein
VCICVLKTSGLQVEHVGVTAVLRHQCLVRTIFHHLSIGQHDNAISAAHRGKAVGDENSRQPLRQFQEAIIQPGLGPHVQGGRGFVQDKNAGTGLHGKKGPRQRYPLPLAAGQIHPILVFGREDGVPAVGQRLDQVQNIRFGRRSPQPLYISGQLGRAKGDIVAGR